MSDRQATTHLTPDRIEAYLEDALAAGERAVVESHLVGCTRCQSAIDEWRTLFEALASLRRPAPAPGFAERVIAGVRTRRPWYVRALAWLDGLLPQTTTGWALATAMLAIPVLTFGGATAWLLSKPWITVQGLWVFATTRAGRALATLFDAGAEALLSSTAVTWLDQTGRGVLEGAGLSALGAGIAGFALLTAVSTWVLYRYLFRTTTRDNGYVSYCL